MCARMPDWAAPFVRSPRETDPERCTSHSRLTATVAGITPLCTLKPYSSRRGEFVRRSWLGLAYGIVLISTYLVTTTVTATQWIPSANTSLRMSTT